MEYTIENVENLEIHSLDAALSHSLDKWDWLIDLSGDELSELLGNKEISIDGDDCPMCKFMRDTCKEKWNKCKYCVLMGVCEIEYQDIPYFSKYDDKDEWNEYAQELRNRIQVIYDAIFGG